MANVGSPEWKAYEAAYIEALKEAEKNGMKGWEHANCDHGNGYCQVDDDEGKCGCYKNEFGDWMRCSAHGKAEQEAREADAFAWARAMHDNDYYYDEP